MKKHLISFLIVVCLGAFTWAQGTKTDLFDLKRSQQELEIMKGILSTTLNFVSQEIKKPATPAAASTEAPHPFAVYPQGLWSFSRISAYYLYGQGAVFVIPSSGWQLRNLAAASPEGYERAMEAYGQSVEALSASMAKAQADMEVKAAIAGVVGGVPGGMVGGVPGTPPAAAPQAAQTPKTPTPPPAPKPQINQEQLRKAQERVKKSQEDIEANRARLNAALAQIKVYLIEALANHGDSLTTVKANEYITLVIATGDSDSTLFLGNAASTGTHQEIISVQKSWITDYKTGKLSLDAFKQKVLQYSE